MNFKDKQAVSFDFRMKGTAYTGTLRVSKGDGRRKGRPIDDDKARRGSMMIMNFIVQLTNRTEFAKKQLIAKI